MHLRKHQKKELKEIDEAELLKDVTFPDSGTKIIFNQYDYYRNESMYIAEWTRFIRMSYTYTQLTPEGI